MKKLLLSIIGLFSITCLSFNIVARANIITGIKYQLNYQINNISKQVTVYQKGNKIKIINSGDINYMDKATGKTIVYSPKQNTAVSIQAQDKDTMMIIDNNTINEYKKYFIKAGSKIVNGYPCTVYKNNSQGIEACISESYGLAIYFKSPQMTMNISNISNAPLTDNVFQLPAGVKVQNLNTLMQLATNNTNINSANITNANTPITISKDPNYFDWSQIERNQPINTKEIASGLTKIQNQIADAKKQGGTHMTYPDLLKAENEAINPVSIKYECSSQKDGRTFTVEIYSSKLPKTVSANGQFWAYYKKSCEDKGGRLPSPQELADVAADLFGTNIEINKSYNNLKVTSHVKTLLSHCGPINELGEYGSDFYSNDPGNATRADGTNIPSDMRTHASASIRVKKNLTSLARGEADLKNPYHGLYSAGKMLPWYPTNCNMCIFNP